MSHNENSNTKPRNGLHAVKYSKSGDRPPHHGTHQPGNPNSTTLGAPPHCTHFLWRFNFLLSLLGSQAVGTTYHLDPRSSAARAELSRGEDELLECHRRSAFCQRPVNHLLSSPVEDQGIARGTRNRPIRGRLPERGSVQVGLSETPSPTPSIGPRVSKQTTGNSRRL
ncbi:hypothetical protein N657DRAFT_238136 [Parathielavia appendiculata]|uniref:Uncharacterized protein n=1 Tax=Parathielavia appendiculata TaxID=2587402 RepID=A0AAN6U8U4_9PEZI|nr:hypothetical protein N657DRAFT_238136 [Parathielavia appendiculata]